MQSLAWKLGSSHKIIIRSDQILGTGEDYRISDIFIHCINSRGIFFWKQVISAWRGPFPIWKCIVELGLNGQMAREWEQIITGTKLLSICREGDRDQIALTSQMKAENVMVADIYSTLCHQKVHHLVICDFYNFWKTKVPINIILFLWLVWKNKNLT